MLFKTYSKVPISGIRVRNASSFIVNVPFIINKKNIINLVAMEILILEITEEPSKWLMVGA